VRWAVRVEPRSDSQCAGHMARRKVVFETWGGVGRGEGGEGRRGACGKLEARSGEDQGGTGAVSSLRRNAEC
jgi:hypothetical protein